MQIHELNQYQGTPGANDYLAIDNGSDTAKISAKDLVNSGISNRIWYGTCSTSLATTAKVVTCAGFELKTGETIAVKFTNKNNATAPTLNVNGTGAIAIKRKSGGTENLAGLWEAGMIVLFTYDGTNWIVSSDSASAGVLVLSKTGVTSLTTDIDDTRISPNHVLVDIVLSNPAAQTADWTWQTYNGYIRFGPSGAISGSTDIYAILAYQTNS